MKFWKISECVCWEDVLNTPEVCVSEHLVPHHFVLFSNLKNNQVINVNASSILEMLYLLSNLQIVWM